MITGKEVDPWSHEVIGAAIEVHRTLGPGLLESVYQKCLAHECSLRGLDFREQVVVDVCYKGVKIAGGFRADLVIQNKLVVEIKAVEAILPIHKAQVYSYMKLMKIPVGLLINFHEPLLKAGIHRLFLKSES